jgi:hypothetical protein
MVGIGFKIGQPRDYIFQIYILENLLYPNSGKLSSRNIHKLSFVSYTKSIIKLSRKGPNGLEVQC